MKPGLSFLKQLLDLINGVEINHGEFQGASRKLLDNLITDGALDYSITGTQRKRIFCSSAQVLRSYLHNKHGITSIEDYIVFLQKDGTERSEAVRVASNSKVNGGKLFQGFFINTFNEIYGTLNNLEVPLKSSDGTHLFVHDFINFSIPKDVTIVVVEGYQNFRDINQQQHLFEGLNPIFLWRYQNMNTIVEWLKTNSNPCLHFGDFDLAGLKIYITEFRNKLPEGRCRFFYPDNLEFLLVKYGNRKLFDEQYNYVKDYDFNSCPEIQTPVVLIKKYKKGLEQEILINAEL